MKRIGIVLVMLMIGVAAFAKSVVSADSLPQNAKNFIANNFAGKKISYAEGGNKEWDVVLDDGTEIDFFATGEWKQIESRQSIPASILPEAVAKQVAATTPNEAIIKIEKKRGTYEVKLANRSKLHISEDGTLIAQKTEDAKTGASKRNPPMEKPMTPKKVPQPKKPDTTSSATRRNPR